MLFPRCCKNGVFHGDDPAAVATAPDSAANHVCPDHLLWTTALRDFPAPLPLSRRSKPPAVCNAKSAAKIVFFYHDSDHDPRETVTMLTDRHTGHDARLNFEFANKVQKQFSPLFAKRVLPAWREKTARQLPNFVDAARAECFRRVEAENVADFCLEMYRRLGLLEGMTVRRSGDPEFRRRAIAGGRLFRGCAVRGRDRPRPPRWRTTAVAQRGRGVHRTALAGVRRPRRSARRATRACAGCNRSSDARITWPARARSNT